jgi:O-succinylbenzoate synthase
MRVAAITARPVRWAIAGTGAARGRGERAAILVEVRTAEGAIGLGEAAPLPGTSVESLDDAARAIERFAARAPFEVAEVDDALAQTVALLGAARFAIETALLDALAQLRGATLAELLVPAPAARVELAAVVDDAQDARRAYAAGIRCLKLKLYPGDDLGRMRAIAAAAPGARLRIDGNRQWPRHRLEELLAPLRFPAVEYVEEPCPATHLALDAGAWFALDESLVELPEAELRTALAHPSLVALVLKPTVLGGISAVRALAALARSCDVAPVLSHALEGPIGTAACAELARAVMTRRPPVLDRAVLGARPELARAAGLAAHPALAGWTLAVPQLAADHLHAAGPGLGFAGLDLAGAVRACPEPA